jgi:peroxiredoxin
MLLITIFIGWLLGYFIWHIYIQKVANEKIKIPPSNNISYNQVLPDKIDAKQLINLVADAQGKPILLYFYTTWCGICVKNFDFINTLAKEMQNTNLQILAIAVDKELSALELQQYHNKNNQDLYFKPYILTSKAQFVDFLKQTKVDFRGAVPYTAIIGKDGKEVFNYIGIKDYDYLKSKVIKYLYLNRQKSENE